MLIRAVFFTYKIKIKHNNLSKTLTKPLSENIGVFFFWHQNIIAGAAFFFKYKFKFHCIVSPSKDGKLAAFITKKLGLKVLHGSEHKKPIALLRNAINILKNKKQIFLVGDGSRGPAKKLKPGVKYLAEKSDLPIIFIDIKVSKKITLKKTWDQFQIPLPFSKITVELKQCQINQYLLK